MAKVRLVPALQRAAREEAANVVIAEAVRVAVIAVETGEAVAEIAEAVTTVAVVQEERDNKNRTNKGFQRCYNRSVPSTGNHRKAVSKEWRHVDIPLRLDHSV